MTPPNDLRRQVLAAVERVRAMAVIETPECSASSDAPAFKAFALFHFNHGRKAALDAILAEFGMNPDGTMKEPTDADV